MKLFSNKKYNQISAYVLAVVAISILMVVAVFRFEGILNSAYRIINVLTPVIWGIIISYILNPVMVFFEKNCNKFLFKKKPRKKAARIISVVFTTLFLILVFGLIIYFVVPELINNITSLMNSNIIGNTTAWVNKIIEENDFLRENIPADLNLINEIDSLISDWQPTIYNLGAKALTMLGDIATGIWNFLIGIIVAVYLMFSKETLVSQLKKIAFALFSKKTCEKAFSFYHNSSGKFIGYINGTLIDSFLVGVICALSMTILGFQNNVILISVIVGVTNIIPFFGPFIGAVPSALLILFAEPNKFLMFLIFIFLLQQLDGNIITPKILGETTGLPAFWVLFSLLLGGGLFGLLGMVLCVPVFAIIYGLVKSYIELRLDEKHLPKETEMYLGDVSHFYSVKRAKDMSETEQKFADYLSEKRPVNAEELAAASKPTVTEISDEPEFLSPKKKRFPRKNSKENKAVKKDNSSK